MKKLLLFAALFLCALAARAEFPEHSFHFIVPFPSGTATDFVGRRLADEMRKDLNQPFVVENKPGAHGVVGGQALLSAPADGYTVMLVGVTTAASNVTLLKSLPFHPLRDFAPIGYVAEFPFFLIAGLDAPFNNIPELIAYAKQHPKKVTFASGAVSSQVAAAQLASQLGIQVTLVPYLSSVKALTDLMGGRLDLVFSDFSVGLVQARAGKVKPFGVSSRERYPLAPEVPTLAEAGAPGYEMIVWFGLVANAKVPPEIIAKLSASLNRSLKSEPLVKSFAAQGLTAKGSTPAEFGAFLKSEVQRWAKMTKEAGIEPQ